LIHYKKTSTQLMQKKGYVPFRAKYEEKTVLDDYLHEVGNFAEVDYLGYEMPGSDEEPRHDWCGTWGTKGCLNSEKHPEEKDFVKSYLKSCYSPLCPTCKNPWLYREAKAATKRIEYYAKKSGKHVKHLVWSPAPYNPIIHKSLKVMRKACYAAMKEIHFTGAAVIFHAYRDRVVNGYKEWYYSPHFHLVGFGWVEGTKEYHAKNKTVIVNLGERESVFATFVYQLSHCAIKKRHHSLTWIGSLSYSELKIPKVPDEDDICPYCSAPLVNVQLKSGFDPPDEERFKGLFEPGMYWSPQVPSSHSQPSEWKDLVCMEASDKATKLIRSLGEDEVL